MPEVARLDLVVNGAQLAPAARGARALGTAMKESGTAARTAETEIEGYVRSVTAGSGRASTAADTYINTVRRQNTALRDSSTIARLAGQEQLSAADSFALAVARQAEAARASAASYRASLQQQAAAAQEAARQADILRVSQTEAFRDLRQSVDPAFAALVRYERQQEQVAQAVRAGAATQEEAARVLRLAAVQYRATGAAAQTLSAQSARSGAGLRNIGQAATNASFQVQDFAVQVAAGTAATTALSQQLPQLLGAFGFTGRLALAGSLLGTLVAVGAAIAPVLLRQADATKETSDATEDLVRSTQEYISSTERAQRSSASLTAEYGRNAAIARDLFQAQSFINATRLQESFEQFVGTATGGLQDLLAVSSDVFDAIAGDADALAAFESQVAAAEEALAAAQQAPGIQIFDPLAIQDLESARNNLEDVTSQMDLAVSIAGQIQERFGVSEAAARRMAASFRDAADGASLSDSAMRAMVDAITVALAQAEDLSEAVRTNSENLLAALEAQLASKAAAEARATAEDALAERIERSTEASRQQIEIQQAITRFGRESAQVAEIRAGHEAEALRATLLNGRAMADLTAAERAAVQEAVNLNTQASRAAGAISSASGAANGLSNSLAGAAAQAASLVSNLGLVPAAVAGLAQQAQSVTATLERQNAALNFQINDGLSAQAASLRAARDAALNAAEVQGASAEDLARIASSADAQIARVQELSEANQGLNQTLRDRATATNGGGGGGGGGAAGAQSALNDLMAEGAALTESLRTPSELYADNLANVTALLDAGAISQETFNRAVAELDEELGTASSVLSDFASSAGDILADGLVNGFDDVGDQFEQLLRDLAVKALSNKITIFFETSLGGGSGIGGLGGGVFQNLFSGLQGGLQQSLSGGLGGIFNIGANAAAAGGGFGATLGAALPVIGLVGLAISAFTERTRTLDTGIRLTIDNLDTLVESFETVESSRFFGLSKSVSTSFEELSEDAARPFVSAVDAMREGIIGMAADVGVAEDAFDNFAHRFQVSTAGLDSEAAQAAVENALKGAADALAERAFIGTEAAVDFPLIAQLNEQIADLRAQSAVAVAKASDIFLTEDSIGERNRIITAAENSAATVFNLQIQEINDQIEDLQSTQSIYIRDSETASEALERLSSAINTTNRQFEFMELAMFEVSIAGADMASQLVDLVGGVEAFTENSARFLQNYYSEAERTGLLTRDLAETFANFNVALPTTRAEYRNLVEAQDLTTEAGRELYSILLLNADAFAEITPAVAALSASLLSAFQSSATAVSEQVAISQQAAQQFEASAQLWFRTADTLRDFIRDLESSELGGGTAAERTASARAAFEAAARAVRAGDIDAAGDIPDLANTLLANARETATTGAEFRALSAQVASEVRLLAGVANLEGANDVVIADLFTQQGQLLETIQTFITLGDASDEQLAAYGNDLQLLLRDFDGTVSALQNDLSDLETAINAAEDFSYSQLQERLNVTLDVIATADIPPGLQGLLEEETGLVTRQVDMLLRNNELTPDLLFVAVNQASEHEKLIRFLATEEDLPPALRRIAIDEASTLLKRIAFVIDEEGFTPETRQIALATSSELTRTLRVAVAADVPNDVIRLALQNASTTSVVVDAALAADIDPDARRIALQSAGQYTAQISATINQEGLNDRQRRILLQQQGDYIARVAFLIDERASNIGGLVELLDGTGGRITIGGGVSVDPSSAFSEAIETGFTAPLEGLRDSFDALRDTLIAEAEDQLAAQLLTERLQNTSNRIADLALRQVSVGEELAGIREAGANEAGIQAAQERIDQAIRDRDTALSNVTSNQDALGERQREITAQRNSISSVANRNIAILQEELADLIFAAENRVIGPREQTLIDLEANLAEQERTALERQEELRRQANELVAEEVVVAREMRDLMQQLLDQQRQATLHLEALDEIGVSERQ